MSGFVIDASIAIKWVIEEPDTALALALRRRPLIAPELLAAECANILWKKAGRSELTVLEAELAARLLVRADIELWPMRPLMAAAVTMALALDHPAYDCVYLALAEVTNLPFVTADVRLLSRISRDRTGRFAGRALALPTAAASVALEAE